MRSVHDSTFGNAIATRLIPNTATLQKCLYWCSVLYNCGPFKVIKTIYFRGLVRA